jgi:hypothetical protein
MVWWWFDGDLMGFNGSLMEFNRICPGYLTCCYGMNGQSIDDKTDDQNSEH